MTWTITILRGLQSTCISARVGKFRAVTIRALTAPPTVPEARPVVHIGNPALRARCLPCRDADPVILEADKEALLATLEDFRKANGFGRGIAAPQIGSLWRFIAVNMGDGPRLLSDPIVSWRSTETFTLYDDCMSLPWLLCRVMRFKSISVTFTNEHGEEEVWSECSQPLSELLQHEIDHLDGVLITDIAEPHDVDYFIVPTIDTPSTEPNPSLAHTN